jgi:heavy metal sensor kinase
MKPHWPGHSVRVRLTLWYTAALTVVLVLYAGGVLVFLQHRLATELDRQVHDDFEVAEQMVEWTSEGEVRWRTDPHHAGSESGADTEQRQWVEVWSPEGRLLYRSPASENTALGPAPVWSQAAQGPASRTLPGDRHLRLLQGAYAVGGHPVVIRVARSEAPLRHALWTFLLVLVLGLPLAVALAGVGGYALARRVLAPVGRMADQTRRITAERLGERLPVANPADELGQLAAVFNDTLARLERSFAQMRRFTADASHELRTPLTAIRSVGEVGLRAPRDVQTYREIIGTMLEEVDRLRQLVEGLLTLSRADAGSVPLTPEPVDLTALAREVAHHLGVLAEEKHQSLAVEATQPVSVWVDRLVLRQALINVVDNAIKYSADKATIRVVVAEHQQGATLAVIDTGPGIAPQHRAHVFDRFYRVDTARAREGGGTGGTGLGLSIARWAVEVHGGRIELESEEGQGSTFRMVLPASTSQPSSGRTMLGHARRG